MIGDDNRLQQIVWNLLANAVKYTAKGGTIDVEAGRTGSRAAIRVKDSGDCVDGLCAARGPRPRAGGGLSGPPGKTLRPGAAAPGNLLGDYAPGASLMPHSFILLSKVL